MSHAALQTPERGPDVVAGFRLILGAALLAIGVCLGLYLVSVVLTFIQNDKPIPLIRSVLDPAVEQIDAQIDAKVAAENQPFDVSADLKRMIVLGIAAILFLFPTLIATTMISGGVSLMKNDSEKMLQNLATKLGQSNR